MENEADERKLSALRKVNLMETTEKKRQQTSERQLVNPVETMEAGTSIGNDLVDEAQELNDQLDKLEF